MLRIVGRFHSITLKQKSPRILELRLYKRSPRQYSSKHGDLPPPPKPQTSGTWYTLGALALAGGATIGYAKYDPEFRKSLVDSAPFTDSIIKFVFQEEPINPFTYVSEYYDSVKKSLSGLIGGGDVKPETKRVDLEKPQPKKEYKAPPPLIPKLEKDIKNKEEQSYAEIRLDNKGKPDIEFAPTSITKSAEPKSEVHPTNLAELEEKIRAAATEAVNAYNKAIYNLKVYSQDIGLIIDDPALNAKPNVWDSVRDKTREKNESIKLAEEKAEEAAKNVNKLKELISKPNLEASENTREMIRANIQKVQDDISDAKKQFELERRLGSTTEKYWEKVEKARKHFSDELECLFPTINLAKKQLEIDGADLDLFLLHAYSTVLFYQKELAKLEIIGQERLQAAVDAARRGGGEALTNAQICEAVDQEKRRLTICFQQQCLKLRQEAEGELRDQLKRQSQVFSDHLDEAVNTRALEIERALSRKLDEQLEAEKIKYKTQLAAVVGRLQGVDYALKARDDADKAAKQSQVLWSACQALLRAIKTGCPGIPWKEQLRPLDPEISSVQKAAAQGDELVTVVINGIPPEAKERGVFPEDALRERFLKVEEMARNLALVPDEGGALPLYILSYLQSFLLIKSASPIPQSELNDEAIDFSQLSTNEILQRARYWLDRGDFAQTLKYMNLLKGAPRSIARQWMNETRILLETQQAANTLMAHAASSGLMYL